MEERLIGVETRVAFLERSLEQLDGVVRELSERLDLLQRHLERHQQGDRPPRPGVEDTGQPS